MGRIKVTDVFRRSGHLTRDDSRAPLLERNNNSRLQTARDQGDSGHNNPVDQNTFNIHSTQEKQEEMTFQNLAELLRVPPEAVCDVTNDTRDGSVLPEAISGQQNLNPGIVHLLDISVCAHLPEPPAELDKSLQKYLANLQRDVHGELLRLSGALGPMRLMGELVKSYHCHICSHLDDLLQRTHSFKHCFALVKWTLKTYLSPEMLGDPELKEMDPVKNIDLLLFSRWVVKATDRLLEHTQTEIRGYLEKILLINREANGCSSEEAYVGTFMDTIKCIAAMPAQAQLISSKLSGEVKEVCFQELQTFVVRYGDEQSKVLKKTAKTDKPEMILFFRTLKTCQELKKYVTAEGTSLSEDIEKTLRETEAFTWELLKAMVVKVAKGHLEVYFRSENKQFFFLIEAVRNMFPQLETPDDVQKHVTDEVHQIIARTYIEQLLKTKQRTLERCWSLNIAQKVSQDADLLHDTMTQLVTSPPQHPPALDGIQRNSKLEKIREVLELNDHNALKVTVSAMQRESLTPREDLELLHKLLRWKGLSKSEVREVLDAIPEDFQPKPRAWYCCLG